MKEHSNKDKYSKNFFYLIKAFFREFWIIITNIIVNLFTYGFNLIGIKTTIQCLDKELNYVIFDKLKTNNYFNYE